MNPRATVVHAPAVDRRPKEGQTEAQTSEPPPVRTAPAVRLPILSAPAAANDTCSSSSPSVSTPPSPAPRARVVPLRRRLPPINLRDLLDFRADRKAVPIDEVEPGRPRQPPGQVIQVGL